MSKSLLLVAFLAGGLAQEDPLLAEAVRGYAHPWAGFREGSTVRYRETVKVPSIDEKGNLVHREVSSEAEWTVASAQGDRALLKIEREGQESEIPFHLALPGWLRGKAERKGTERIAVGDRSFECEVLTLSVDADKDAGQVTTIAKAAGAPSWAVRVRVETFERGRPIASEEELLVSCAEPVRVAGREVVCHVVRVTTEAPGVGRTVRTEWRSEEVPGRLVRRDTRQYQGEKEITLAATHLEVVRFEARK